MRRSERPANDPGGTRAQPRHRQVPADLRARFPGHVPAIYTHPDTLLVAFAFECNLACTFCMVEDALGSFAGTPLDVFEAFVAHPEAMRGITRVILSGGEVTLDEHLGRYVEVARRGPDVEHVRIQTNATRLSHAPYVDRLLGLGVDEFFVSLHGHEASTCDAVTQRSGSFRNIMRGIETLAARGATWLSNTCIVDRNVDHLADIATLAADNGAAKA